MKRQARALITHLLTGIVAVGLLAACSKSEDSITPTGAATGGLAIRATWDGNPSGTRSAGAFQPLAAPPSVIQIAATVFGGSPGMDPVSKIFPAGDSAGTFGNIPAGTGRTLILQGNDSGGITLYESTTPGVTITAGASTTVNAQLSVAAGFVQPGQVTGFTATAGNNLIDLDLTLPTDGSATGVLIRRAIGTYPDSYRDGDQVYNGDGSGLPYTDNGVANGTRYFYKAFSYNADGIYSLGITATAAPSVVGVPDNLVATAGDGQVTVTWDIVSGVDGYQVFRSTTTPIPSITPNDVIIGDTTTTQTITGLTNGVPYYFAVLAYVGLDSSARSLEASAVPQPPAPTSAPGSFTATASDHQVTLNWTTVADATGYNIYWGTSTGVDNRATNIPVAGQATASYTQSGLTNGTTYYYVVAAENGGGEGPLSTEVSATPYAAGVPDGVAAISGNRQITVNWNKVTAPTVATAYNLYWSTTAGTGTAGTKIVLGDVATYTQTGLGNGTTVYYVVTAILTGLEGPPSPQVSATALAPAPANFTAMAGNVKVDLAWSAVPNADSYNLYWSTTPNQGTGGTKITVTGATSYAHTGLVNGTAYYYVVTTASGTGESAPTVQVQGTPNVPPATPTGLAAAPGDAEVTLTWTAVGGVTYNLYWSETNGAGTSGSKISAVTSPYTHTGRTNGTPVYYVLTAEVAGVQSAPTAQVSATPVAPPVAPTGLTATKGDTEVVLNWTASAGATGYNVYWANVAGVTTAGTQIALGNVATYTHTGLSNGTPYFYIVTAVNIGGESAASNEAGATPQVPAPAAPTGLAAAAGDTQVTLTWTAAAGATSYNVYYATATIVDPTVLTPLTGVAGPPYAVTGLPNGTQHFFKVSAVNPGGEGPLSTEVFATPLPPPVGAPTGVTATPGLEQVALSWTAPTGVTVAGYKIYWSTVTGTGTAGTLIDLSTNPATTYTHTGRTAHQTVYYVVTTITTPGPLEGAASSEVSATPWGNKWGSLKWGSGKWGP